MLATAELKWLYFARLVLVMLGCKGIEWNSSAKIFPLAGFYKTNAHFCQLVYKCMSCLACVLCSVLYFYFGDLEAIFCVVFLW